MKQVANGGNLCVEGFVIEWPGEGSWLKRTTRKERYGNQIESRQSTYQTSSFSFTTKAAWCTFRTLETIEKGELRSFSLSCNDAWFLLLLLPLPFLLPKSYFLNLLYPRWCNHQTLLLAGDSPLFSGIFIDANYILLNYL